MQFKWLFLLSVFLLLSVACEMDNFLFNDKKTDHYSLPGNTIPSSLIEQVTFTSDGNTLYGFWIKSNGERPGLTILYCHGNKHNIDEYWDRVMLLHYIGVNVFIFDYRGFGLSEGESSEAGLFKDGEAAIEFLCNHYQLNEDSLCIYGYSLGNVPSIYLTADKCNPLCLIAEAPFASANSLIQGSVLLDIPSRWLTEGGFNNSEMIKHITTPFMLIHGEKDDFVRYRDNGRVIYENAPEPKLLVLVHSANHNDIPLRMGFEVYKKAIEDWINYSIYIKKQQ